MPPNADGRVSGPALALDGSPAALVPVKAFHEAKARLAPVLDPAARAELARQMATQVVRAAAPLPVAVVCNDPAVARWAHSVGAAVLDEPGQGLNQAVAGGVAQLLAAGASEVVVAHGDLPGARQLVALTGFGGITLVPDRRRDGTNVICVPAGVTFGFSYGPGSFERHLAAAHRLGVDVRVVDEPDLAWDVDVPDDLVVGLVTGGPGRPGGPGA